MFNKLAEFYNAYSDWIDAGAHDGEPFSRRVGLCASLCEYLREEGIRFKEREMALLLMKSQFIKAGLNRDYPFNNKENLYCIESIHGRIHTNIDRIAWVKMEWKHYV